MPYFALQKTRFPNAVQAGEIQTGSEPRAFFGLLQMLEELPAYFAIIEPGRQGRYPGQGLYAADLLKAPALG